MSCDGWRFLKSAETDGTERPSVSKGLLSTRVEVTETIHDFSKAQDERASSPNPEATESVGTGVLTLVVFEA